MQDKKLDFFVIGAQKCATSWLYYCLRDHPQIVLPMDKSELGYIGGAAFRERGEQWFFDRFPPSSGATHRGDVSVDYLSDPSAAQACLEYSNANPKIIASLRHPVSRAISSYYWYVRRKSLPMEDPNIGLEPILRSKPGFPGQLEGFYEQIVRRSCYGGALETYIRTFGASQVMVVEYEALSDNNLEQLQAIYGHIGVNREFVPASIHDKAKKNAYNPFLLRFERLHGHKVIAKLANYANQVLAFLGMSGQPGIRQDVLERLQELFEPEIARTREVLASLPPGQRPTDERLPELWAQPVRFRA